MPNIPLVPLIILTASLTSDNNRKCLSLFAAQLLCPRARAKHFLNALYDPQTNLAKKDNNPIYIDEETDPEWESDLLRATCVKVVIGPSGLAPKDSRNRAKHLGS